MLIIEAARDAVGQRAGAAVIIGQVGAGADGESTFKDGDGVAKRLVGTVVKDVIAEGCLGLSSGTKERGSEKNIKDVFFHGFSCWI